MDYGEGRLGAKIRSVPSLLKFARAMTVLQAEVPELRAHLEKMSRHLDDRQGFDALYAQRELLQPLLDMTRPLLQPSSS